MLCSHRWAFAANVRRRIAEVDATDWMRPQGMAATRFSLILIRPSHYDDDGYVIQWARSAIPSNTLAVMYGLAVDCRERHVLGGDVEIEISDYDETNTRVPLPRIIRRMQSGPGLVALVGVKSNQITR